MKNNKYLSIALVALSTIAFSCKKSYLETNPSTAVTDENLYTTTKSCYTVLDGIGRLMCTSGASLYPLGSGDRANDFGEAGVRLADDLMGNDVLTSANNYDWFEGYYDYTGIPQANYAVIYIPWNLYYKVINSSNLLLANIDKATGPDAEKASIKGQAYAFRAWAYYKLSIYYCKTYSLGLSNPGVPIYTTPTTSSSVAGKRGTVGDVYAQIDADIAAAQTNLETANISSENISGISLATFYGIAAKIALVKEDWANAKSYADKAINAVGGSGKLMDADAYKSGFNSSNNSEWMWASVVNESQRTDMGNVNFMSFVDTSNSSAYASGGGVFKKITLALYSKIPAGDVRKQVFAGNRQQTKFHLADPSTWTFDNLYMRLSEMYLIKAEAEANLGDADAITTLETLVQKRNPGYTFAGTPYTGGTDIKQEIYLQRRIELFLEGQSYSDIQRWKTGLNRPSGTGNFSLVTAGVLTIPANSNKFLFKIPQREFDAGHTLTASDQNPD